MFKKRDRLHFYHPAKIPKVWIFSSEHSRKIQIFRIFAGWWKCNLSLFLNNFYFTTYGFTSKCSKNYPEPELYSSIEKMLRILMWYIFWEIWHRTLDSHPGKKSSNHSNFALSLLLEASFSDDALVQKKNSLANSLMTNACSTLGNQRN